MKMTEKEKTLMRLFKGLESEKCKDDLLMQMDAMIRAQNALKADYGLVGLDATLFNGVQNPLYDDRNPTPIGAA